MATTPTSTTSQRSLRFYIDQDNDKAVVRAVPVRSSVVSHATHRLTVAETVGEPVATAAIETRADRRLPSVRHSSSAKTASERMMRLVRRGR
jgi:hypothetical protein